MATYLARRASSIFNNFSNNIASGFGSGSTHDNHLSVHQLHNNPNAIRPAISAVSTAGIRSPMNLSVPAEPIRYYRYHLDPFETFVSKVSLVYRRRSRSIFQSGFLTQKKATESNFRYLTAAIFNIITGVCGLVLIILADFGIKYHAKLSELGVGFWAGSQLIFASLWCFATVRVRSTKLVIGHAVLSTMSAVICVTGSVMLAIAVVEESRLGFDTEHCHAKPGIDDWIADCRHEDMIRLTINGVQLFLILVSYVGTVMTGVLGCRSACYPDEEPQDERLKLPKSVAENLRNLHLTQNA